MPQNHACDDVLNTAEIARTATNEALQAQVIQLQAAYCDIENILCSTDVATLLLDRSLNIRFFTPATRALFSVIPSDIGRPLSDLKSLTVNGDLDADALTVMRTLTPLEQEVVTQKGAWFSRKISPYRTCEGIVDGVVVTFTDMTDRKHLTTAMQTAIKQAETANIAKSRFLAAASHDLRQPLQTLSLLQGMLARSVDSEKSKDLVARTLDTLGSMTGMLNTLLDINQIEAGTVSANVTAFGLGGLIERLKEEFSYHAQARGLEFRVVACELWVESDSQLLEQMLRNLISNAVKYTRKGKILLGCRRHAASITIEVWDTGIGIPPDKLEEIFEEYHQLGNDGRERDLGLGLGLAIVQRLGNLLGHGIQVRSRRGRGSRFSIEIALPQGKITPGVAADGDAAQAVAEKGRRIGKILIVEDEPDIRELLELFFQGEGYQTASVADGPAALAWVERGVIQPDLIVADYNLPRGIDGVAATTMLREKLHRHTPVIILSGDISKDALRRVALHDCAHFSKPVRLDDLAQAITRLAPALGAGRPQPSPQPIDRTDAAVPVIFVIDDDSHVREVIRSVFEDDGQIVEAYGTCEAFLDAYHPHKTGCLLVDAYLPGMGGLDLLQLLNARGPHLPAIIMTGDSDVNIAVQAMKAGASDFIEKPIGRSELLMVVARALELSIDSSKRQEWQDTAIDHMSELTGRQREIMDMVLAGHPSKNIAADLRISQRTVENHRASIMRKTGCKSLPALARLALAAVA